MAEIRWRRQRLMRAEAGILATQKRKIQIEREWKVAEYGKGISGLANDMLIADMGLAGLHPSSSNYADKIGGSQALRKAVESERFKEEYSGFLKLVYGEKASYTADI